MAIKCCICLNTLAKYLPIINALIDKVNFVLIFAFLIPESQYLCILVIYLFKNGWEIMFIIRFSKPSLEISCYY